MNSKIINLIYIFLCIIISSCASFDSNISKPPLIEWCVPLENICFCYDKRQPEGQREKDRPLSYCKGFHCISGDSYNTLGDYYHALLKD